VSRVEIRIDGLDDLFADLRKLGDLSDELLVDTINDVAMDTQNEAVRGIQRGPANGRTYKRGTVTHTASAPGQFPMSDTGRLASNVESILATPANIQAKVGTNIAMSKAFLRHRQTFRPKSGQILSMAHILSLALPRWPHARGFNAASVKRQKALQKNSRPSWRRGYEF
jgi:hypothetical protein